MIKTLAMRPGSEPEVLIPSTEAPGNGIVLRRLRS